MYVTWLIALNPSLNAALCHTVEFPMLMVPCLDVCMAR